MQWAHLSILSWSIYIASQEVEQKKIPGIGENISLWSIFVCQHKDVGW